MSITRKYRSFRVLVNFILWVVFIFVFYIVSGIPNESTLNYGRLINTIIVLVGVYYFNYYVLIPRFLSKRKLKYYALSIVGTLLLVFIFSYFTAKPLNDVFSRLKDSSLNLTVINIDLLSKKPFFINYGIVILSSISFAVSTGIRGTSEWFKNENQLKEIENQKLLAELSYLKAQINPHFFFNILNGIYVLALQKSDKTPEVIMKLSVIMRYIIYEANEPKVKLTKELKHVSNYIDLQKMRLQDIVNVNFNVKGNPKNIMIEPLLFSVFVENAFKHGIDYSKATTIDIQLDIKDDELDFRIENPMVKRTTQTDGPVTGSGIGLDNTKKRLELLYPGKHKLKITETDQKHIVKLKLNIEEV